MDKDQEVRNLAEALESKGAESRQAVVMARQLLKRADQLSKERSISREKALHYLLNLVVAGVSGESASLDDGKNSEKTDT